MGAPALFETQSGAPWTGTLDDPVGFLASAGLPLDRVAAIGAVHTGVWGVTQIFTGALSDHWGRKWPVAIGMWVQAVGIALFVLARKLGEIHIYGGRSGV